MHVDSTGLAEVLSKPEVVLARWLDRYEASHMRLPRIVDRESVAAMVGSIVEALATCVAPDRVGQLPEELRFAPGSLQLRELEKEVSFAAARLASAGFCGFDVGALVFSLRDVLCDPLEGEAEAEMQAYMEWLSVLAGDSLANSRAQAVVERWHNELDDGTPLVMITPELPAALFVCRPDLRVASGVFGRLLLTLVRTGAKAVIIDVRGIAGELSDGFLDPLQRFIGHARVAGKVVVYACGVKTDDVDSWKSMGDKAGCSIIFEDYFDICVSQSLEKGGWRLLHS